MPKIPVEGFKYLFFLSLSFVISGVTAQTKNTLKDSKELIDKGIGLFDENKFKEALAYFVQVPEGDTNYSSAKYEIALTYLADSAFEKGKQAALEGLKLPDTNPRQMLYLVAHAYDYLGKTDSAVYYYDSIARAYPVDNLAYYEKAVVYFQRNDFDKAISLLEKALMINPYHYRSHAVLGNIYMQQGRLTEAFMASAAALLFTSDINVARTAIVSLNAISRQSDEVAEYYDQRKDGYDLYSEIDEIIHARLALDKSYSVRSVMSDEQIVRVAHAIMEKLAYDKNSKNFAMQYYVPLYMQVYQKDMFDPFMLLLFSNYGIDVVDQYAKKQKRDISGVREVVFPYWSKILATRTFEYHKRDKAPMSYAYDASTANYLAGNIGVENGKEVLREGYTKIYDNACLVAEGKFANNEAKDGPWRYYYNNGVTRLTETYKNGVIQGEAREYRRNGFLKEVRKYDNTGKLTEEHEYTYNGILESSVIAKANGESEVILYHPDGKKQATLKVKNNALADGKHKWYYSNGKLEKEIEMLDGKVNGEYKEYYDNGKLKEHGIFRKGDRDGLYITYYYNGQKESELTYSRGKADGERISYNDKGEITGKTTFKDGKRNGMDIQLADGREYQIIHYQNDIPMGYTFKDALGKEIKEESKKLALLKTYYPNGNVKAELPLKDGLLSGQGKFYFITGGLREVVNFADDARDGTATEYYKNGKTYMVSEYVEGERTGWYKGYYSNGQPQAEGWLTNDSKQGVWRFYSIAGKLEREVYFLDDLANGPSRHYDGNGKITFMDYYDRGLIMHMEQYDKTGKLIHSQSFPQGTGKYYFIYSNGNKSFEAQLKNGKYEGAYSSYYPDKSVKEKGFYKNGSNDSLYVSYYPGGQESYKGNLRNGAKDGLWTHYDFDGKVARETDYSRGREHGKDKVYLGGELRNEFNSHYDELDGEQLYYGEGKNIALVFNYKGRELTGYTYVGKDGKLVPPVPVKNGTARVITYYPNGNKAVELAMKENLYEGRRVTYFTNGNVAEEKTYAATDLNGPFKRFYLDGKPLYEATFKDDVLNGEEKIYGENGKLLIHSNYVMGDMHGPQIYNSPKTGKSYKVTFEYGRLITMEIL